MSRECFRTLKNSLKFTNSTVLGNEVRDLKSTQSDELFQTLIVRYCSASVHALTTGLLQLDTDWRG